MPFGGTAGDVRLNEVARHVLDARPATLDGLRRHHVSAAVAALPAERRGGPLDADGAMTENFPERTMGEVDQLAAEKLDELRAQVAELRASRERLVLAADADRRRIERALHGSVQQLLAALAMRLQLAQSALESDPAAAKALLEELGRDVQDIVDEAARLAQRIYVPLLELGLAPALRAAAASAGTPALVEVSAGSDWPPEILHTVYACWLETLEHAGDVRPEITVREDAGALVFEVVRDPPDAGLDALRDRVEALGGTLATGPEADGRVRVSGSLQRSR